MANPLATRSARTSTRVVDGENSVAFSISLGHQVDHVGDRRRGHRFIGVRDDGDALVVLDLGDRGADDVNDGDGCAP